MVQEAAQVIRRHYRNTYKYGSGAKTICKEGPLLFLKQNQPGSIQSLDVRCMSPSVLQTWLPAVLTIGLTNSASNTPSHLSCRTAGDMASSCHRLTFPKPATKLWLLWRPLLSKLSRKRKLTKQFRLRVQCLKSFLWTLKHEAVELFVLNVLLPFIFYFLSTRISGDVFVRKVALMEAQIIHWMRVVLYTFI